MHNKIKFNIIIKNLTALYIEDEDGIRQNVKESLSLICKDVIAVENITEADNIFFSDNNIDFIISDINLNDENGLDFIEKIRLKDKKIPIVIISAYTDKNYLLQAAKLKLTDYLVKPINFEQLIEALKKVSFEIEENNMLSVQVNTELEFNIFELKLYNTISHEEIPLTSKELKLLLFLIENKNKIISQDEIKKSIWEFEDDATDSAFKNLFNKLRKKIGKDTITNFPKIGYKLNIK